MAIAYSFENVIASNPGGPSNTVKPIHQYAVPRNRRITPLSRSSTDNIDVAVINIAHEDLSRYDFVMVPRLYLLDNKRR